MEYSARVLRECTEQVHLSLHPDQERIYADLLCETPRVFDSGERTGPLGGLVAAAQAFPGDDWLVLAVDMIGMTGEEMGRLVREAQRSPGRSVVFLSEHGPEPTATLYRYGDIQKMRESSRTLGHSLQKNLGPLDCVFLTVTNGNVIKNINTRIALEEELGRNGK